MFTTATEPDLPVGHERPEQELIDVGQTTPLHPTPLLFVHGEAHAAWCWHENFLDYFAARGYRAVAVSLSGHGGSGIYKPFQDYSIKDYIDDVAAAANSLPTTPVLVGHSTGGFVVEKYLDTHRPPAVVLMASVPPRHSSGTFLRMIRRHPWALTMGTLAGEHDGVIHDPKWARQTYFTSHTPAEDVDRWTAQFSPESVRAELDWLMASRPYLDRVDDPVLVLGAEEDACCTAHTVRATANAYHTKAEFFPGMGHDMMLEPGWEKVAERIDGWLSGLRL